MLQTASFWLAVSVGLPALLAAAEVLWALTGGHAPADAGDVAPDRLPSPVAAARAAAATARPARRATPRPS